MPLADKWSELESSVVKGLAPGARASLIFGIGQLTM